MKNFEILVKRELKILFVSVKHILSYSSFFLLVFLLFAFSVGPNLKTLSSIYLPILFMIILFSLILTSENFIDEDFKNGFSSQEFFNVFINNFFQLFFNSPNFSFIWN